MPSCACPLEKSIASKEHSRHWFRYLPQQCHRLRHALLLLLSSMHFEKPHDATSAFQAEDATHEAIRNSSEFLIFISNSCVHSQGTPLFFCSITSPKAGKKRHAHMSEADKVMSQIKPDRILLSNQSKRTREDLVQLG